MDPSHPRKETQEQRIRRVMHRGNMEVAIAFLLHLALLGFYVYVHIYDGTIFKRTKGKGFLGHNKFGGRWKFLTYIDLVSLYTYVWFQHRIFIVKECSIRLINKVRFDDQYDEHNSAICKKSKSPLKIHTLN